MSGDVGLLSIDLNGNDLYVLQIINAINSRVIIMEYNARFAPPISYCMNYNETINGMAEINLVFHCSVWMMSYLNVGALFWLTI